jgi:hypothetical protein
MSGLSARNPKYMRVRASVDRLELRKHHLRD